MVEPYMIQELRSIRGFLIASQRGDNPFVSPSVLQRYTYILDRLIEGHVKKTKDIRDREILGE